MLRVSFGAVHAAHLLRRHRWHQNDTRPWSTAEWTNAMCGEAGEAANIAKKLLRCELGAPGNRGATEDEMREKLARELADVVHYAIIAAERAGVDLEQAMIDTFNEKSEELGFPERLRPEGEVTDEDVDHAVAAMRHEFGLRDMVSEEDAVRVALQADRKRHTIVVQSVADRGEPG